MVATVDDFSTVGLSPQNPTAGKPPTVATTPSLLAKVVAFFAAALLPSSTVSNIRRLRLSDRIFFVTTNLRRAVRPLGAAEYPLIIDAFGQARTRLGFALCGYVLMPDHLHALFAMSSPLTVSRVLRDIKTSMTQKLHKARGIKGPMWQHQFWDRFVRNQREFHEHLDYMHMNPVRKGLVTQPEAWRWSSCANFSPDKAKAQQCPIQIDFVQLPEDYCA